MRHMRKRKEEKQRQIETQCEETQESKEPYSDMNQMLELTDKEFKTFQRF